MQTVTNQVTVEVVPMEFNTSSAMTPYTITENGKKRGYTQESGEQSVIGMNTTATLTATVAASALHGRNYQRAYFRLVVVYMQRRTVRLHTQGTSMGITHRETKVKEDESGVGSCVYVPLSASPLRRPLVHSPPKVLRKTKLQNENEGVMWETAPPPPEVHGCREDRE